MNPTQTQTKIVETKAYKAEACNLFRKRRLPVPTANWWRKVRRKFVVANIFMFAICSGIYALRTYVKSTEEGREMQSEQISKTVEENAMSTVNTGEPVAHWIV